MLQGVLGLIDSNETDWKLIAINTEDPLAALLHDIEDVEVHCPGAVAALHHWLRHYKAPLINEFAYEGAAKGRCVAERVGGCHRASVLERCSAGLWRKRV